MTHWRSHIIALCLGAAGILLLRQADAFDLIGQWNRSTFAHCWLIPPILAWLVWTRNPELGSLAPRVWRPGLPWIAGGAALCVLGDAGGVALFGHAGLVVMLQGLVPTLLGPAITRALIFPIGYALFMVPFGEELIPPMQIVTADMAMALLRLTGIPATIDGIFITTPGGRFAVAEACSGVKFLVAMAALAVLAARLCFRSWHRRLAFIAFALIVPVIANGVRAYGTIWMAENWGMEFAVGADHLIYGWLFFGAVMAVIGWAASPWFEIDPPSAPVARAAAERTGSWRGVSLTTLAALVITATPLAMMTARDSVSAPLPPLADIAVPGWSVIAAASPADWRARYDGADRRIDVRLDDGRGWPVAVTVVGYATQGQGREVVGFGQGAVDPDSDWAWGQTLAPIGPARVDRIADAGAVRDVLTVYVIQDVVTADPRQVKWRTLVARLTGGREHAYAILLSAQPRGPAQGRDRLDALVTAAGGPERLTRRLTRQP